MKLNRRSFIKAVVTGLTAAAASPHLLIAAPAKKTLSVLPKSMTSLAGYMQQQNEILRDAEWVESNSTYVHLSTRRTSLLKATWRKLNGK